MEEMKQDRIEIKRDRMRPSAKATFGEIYVNGIKMGVTLEPPPPKDGVLVPELIMQKLTEVRNMDEQLLC